MCSWGASPQGLSVSLPSSADILKDANKLKGGLDGLNTAVFLTKDRLNKETSDVKTQINQAKEVRMSAHINHSFILSFII